MNVSWEKLISLDDNYNNNNYYNNDNFYTRW